MLKQKIVKKHTLSFSLFFLIILLSILPLGFSACVNDVCFSEKRTLQKESLELLGVGLLEYLKFDMYVAALYVKHSIDFMPENILDASVSKILVLHYKRGIKVAWMNKAAEKIIQKNPEINYPNIQERVKKIGEAYEKVEAGDEYSLSYMAETQKTTLSLNGQKIIEIEGADFARAYFGIWLSEYPANQDLRRDLLHID